MEQKLIKKELIGKDGMVLITSYYNPINNVITSFDFKGKMINIFNLSNGMHISSNEISNIEDTHNKFLLGNEPMVDIVQNIDSKKVFKRTLPTLLDIGVMGHCLHGQSGKCGMSGVQCYQNGANINSPNMNIQDFKNILDQISLFTFSVALGGRGDVNKHEDFEEILKASRKRLIIPNYTTSGLELTEREVEITKKYCGAVAVSWYRQMHTYNAISMFLKAKVKTNIHYVLGKNSIDEALTILDNVDDFAKTFKGLNAIIFLLHKPIGLGKENNVLNVNDNKVQMFFNKINELGKRQDMPFKIGFDSCTIPAIINQCDKLSGMFYDSCEAGRFSAYITADMKMIPCSFENQSLKHAVDLKNYSVIDAWESNTFEDFRKHFTSHCSKCPKHEECLSGCPIVPQITICDREECDV